MSETAPAEPKRGQDDFRPVVDEIAQERAKLDSEYARKTAMLNQVEAFGVKDKFEGPLLEDGRPIAGSHADYHSQRHSDGIVRDGSGFRQAESGQFASEEGYTTQNGTAQEHYDKLMGFENEGVHETGFENMGIMQLAKEQAKAEIMNDVAGMNEIRGVSDQYMLEQAAIKGSGTTYADLDQAAVRYQKLVEKFKSKELGETSAVEGDEDKDEKPADGEKPVNETEGTKPNETDPNEAPAETPEKEHKVGDTAEYNGETVTLGQKLAGTDKLVAYEVVKSDGSRTLVYEHELTFPEPAAEKESVGEKAKRFWKKGTSFIAEKFTMGYMGARWFVEDSIINRGIDPLTTSFEDAEKIKHRRRIALVAGTAAVLVALAISRDFHGFGSGGGGSHVANALPTDTPTPSPSASEVPTSDGSEFTLPQTPHAPELNPNDPAFTLTPVDQAPTGTPSPDVLGATPTPDALSNPDFTITQGEGGLQLFNRLGIDPAKWAANASRLLQQHGEDFYTRPGGGIGISHPGALSEATRIDLLNIKNS